MRDCEAEYAIVNSEFRVVKQCISACRPLVQLVFLRIQ